ncbi:DUF397 domain-containing protein [Streptomyces sp. NPDC059894]|uniref:DUF397 domain-containing protein n=1 Tax=unclassified Streptomyces TaxID=2593676 RepID=UPI00366588CB
MHVQERKWQKSSFSGDDANRDCVEVTAAPDALLLRESDAPATVLRTTPACLHALLRSPLCERLTETVL